MSEPTPAERLAALDAHTRKQLERLARTLQAIDADTLGAHIADPHERTGFQLGYLLSGAELLINEFGLTVAATSEAPAVAPAGAPDISLDVTPHQEDQS